MFGDGDDAFWRLLLMRSVVKTAQRRQRKMNFRVEEKRLFIRHVGNMSCCKDSCSHKRAARRRAYPDESSLQSEQKKKDRAAFGLRGNVGISNWNWGDSDGQRFGGHDVS